MNIEDHTITPRKKNMALKAVVKDSQGTPKKVVHDIELNEWLMKAQRIALQYHLVKHAIESDLPLEVRIKGTDIKCTAQPQGLKNSIVSVKEHPCKIEGGLRWIYYYQMPQVLLDQIDKNQLKLF